MTAKHFLVLSVLTALMVVHGADKIDHFEQLVPRFKEKFVARSEKLSRNFTNEQKALLNTIAASNQTDSSKVKEAMKDPQIVSILIEGAKEVLRENGVTDGLVEFMAEIMRQGLLHADMGEMSTRQAAQVALQMVPKWVVKYRMMNKAEKERFAKIDPHLVKIMERRTLHQISATGCQRICSATPIFLVVILTTYETTDH